MIVELREQPFDPWAEQAGLLDARPGLRGRFGANAVFVGSMRDYNDGDTVHAMTLEHYPGMTERELERICTECSEGHEVLELLVLHRIGRITPGEDIVLVSVWTPHRAAAFAVCRAVMEELKHHAPFWKKERLADGERWVEQNTPG